MRIPDSFHLLSRLLAAVLTLSLQIPSVANQAQETWTYQLQAGDHLVYSYSLDRETSGDNDRIRTHAEFTTHLLVLGADQGRLAIGFQRNRDSADLLEFTEKGKNKLETEMPAFRRRMANRGPRFSEANEFSYTGMPLQYWEAARESPSKILFAIHEIEVLPDKKVSIGERWRGNRLLGMEFRLAAVESVGNAQCDRIDGNEPNAHLTFWWCPDSHAVQKLEFDGQYPAFSSTAHERIVFELKSKVSNQNLRDWLSSPDTQLAALSSLLRSPTVPVTPEILEPALRTSDAQVQSMALAVMYQRGIRPKDPGLLPQLERSEDQQVSRIAGRILNEARPVPPSSFPPQVLGTTFRVLESSKYQRVPYGLRIPAEYKGNSPFTLLIYLSGGAGFAMDAINSSGPVIDRSDYVVLYPQAGGLWWDSDATEKFSAVLDEVTKHVNIDPSRVYIAGFSNGGTGALYYAARWPRRFAAVISLMGAGDCMDQVAAEIPKLKGIPVLLVHGDRDPLIPVSCSKQTYEKLLKLSPQVPPEFHILKDREHDLTLGDDGGFSAPFLRAHKEVR